MINSAAFLIITTSIMEVDFEGEPRVKNVRNVFIINRLEVIEDFSSQIKLSWNR